MGPIRKLLMEKIKEFYEMARQSKAKGETKKYKIYKDYADGLMKENFPDLPKEDV